MLTVDGWYLDPPTSNPINKTQIANKMEKLTIKVEWFGKNYSGSYAGDNVFGVVAATGSTLDEFKDDFAEAMDFHINGLLDDGDDIPYWATTKQYELEFELQPSAMLRQVSQFVSMAALSRVSGINQKQLEHYAASRKRPRQPQLEKIKNALRIIGEEILSFC